MSAHYGEFPPSTPLFIDPIDHYAQLYELYLQGRATEPSMANMSPEQKYSAHEFRLYLDWKYLEPGEEESRTPEVYLAALRHLKGLGDLSIID